MVFALFALAQAEEHPSLRGYADSYIAHRQLWNPLEFFNPSLEKEPVTEAVVEPTKKKKQAETIEPDAPLPKVKAASKKVLTEAQLDLMAAKAEAEKVNKKPSSAEVKVAKTARVSSSTPKKQVLSEEELNDMAAKAEAEKSGKKPLLGKKGLRSPSSTAKKNQVLSESELNDMAAKVEEEKNTLKKTKTAKQASASTSLPAATAEVFRKKSKRDRPSAATTEN